MKELSNEVIFRAVAGEPDALEAVLKRYGAYLNTCSTEETVTISGRKHYSLNEDLKSCIVIHIIEAAVKWRPLPYADSAR